jgi:hypothetical protein
LVEKWIPPSWLETTKIGQKTEGILGVNSYNPRLNQALWASSKKKKIETFNIIIS